MKILYVSQYFPPEMGAPAARASELARHWVAGGARRFGAHGISQSSHRSRSRGMARPVAAPHLSRESRRRERLPHLALASAQPQAARAHAELRFILSICCIARHVPSSSRRDHRYVAATSGRTLRLVARLRQAVPFVFEVRDLWPESLAAVGAGNENSLLHRSLAKIAGFLYQRSDLIVVVTPAFKNHLIKRWRVPEEKIAVVENGVETDLFAPTSPATTEMLRRELGAESKFLVCYVGTMGMAHGLETLLDAASRLQDAKASILFLLIGEGAEKQRIKGLARIP